MINPRLALAGFAIGLIAGLVPFVCDATEYISVRNGVWHDNSTWHVDGSPRTIDDTAVVADGTKVTIAKDTSCGDLTVQAGGELALGKGVNLRICVRRDLRLLQGSVFVNRGGSLRSDEPGTVFSMVIAGKLKVSPGSRIADANIQWRGTYRLSELYQDCPRNDQFTNSWALSAGAKVTVDMNAGVYRIVGERGGLIRIDAVADKADRRLEFADRRDAGAFGSVRRSDFHCIGNGHYGEGGGKFGVLLTSAGDKKPKHYWSFQRFTDVRLVWCRVRFCQLFYPYDHETFENCRFQNCAGYVRLGGTLRSVHDVSISPPDDIYISAAPYARSRGVAKRVNAPGVRVFASTYIEFVDSVLGAVTLNSKHLNEACVVSRNHNQLENAYDIWTHDWRFTQIRSKFGPEHNVTLHRGTLLIDDHAVCRDLTIGPGAKLIIGAGKRLTVKGKLVNQGALQKRGKLIISAK